MTIGSNQQTIEDIAEAKRNSIHQQKTATNFFVAPTGSTDQFYDTMMSSGLSTISKKLQQPPMLAGKGKVPSDLACVL